MKVNKEFFLHIKDILKDSFNRYLFVGVAFLLVILFFDDYACVKRAKSQAQIYQMEKRIEQYQKEREEYIKNIESLEKGNRYIEKFAREHYYMKSPNEEVFIVNDK